MKINHFQIDGFSREEYTAEQTPKVEGLDGNSLLIKGPNKSGKSLTFAAIAHGLLGNESPLDVPVGSGSSVTIGFTNESEVFRGTPKRQYEVIENDQDEQIEKLYEKDEADEKLRTNIGAVEIVRNHFLPSEVRSLPLERVTGEDRIDLVLSAIDRSAKLELEKKEDDLNELRKEKTRLEDSIEPLNKDKRRRSFQISQLGSQKADWDTIMELADSGRLREIEQQLNNHSEIQERLNRLSKRERGLSRKITSKEKEIEALQRYENSVEEIIAEAITEFVCPVCDDKVDTRTAKQRMSDGNCPFCKETRPASQVKQHIRDQKAETQGRPGKLSTEIAEHKTERSKIRSEIKELENQLPAIGELNTFAVNELEKADSVKELEEKAMSELEIVSETLAEYQDDLAHIESNIRETENEIEETEADLETVANRIQELKGKDAEDRFSDFQNSLNEHFTNVGGDIGEASAVQFDVETGEVLLLSENSGPRKYHRRSELSGSEIQLINIAFVLSLNDHAAAIDSFNWGTLVLDEPFSNFDDEITEAALDYLLELPQQIILTSSDGQVSSWFSNHNTLKLTRSETTQANLSQFERS